MEVMATAPEEPPRAACSGSGGRLNRITVAVGDGCSKNKHVAAPVAVHDSSKVQRRWWLVEEEKEAAAVRCYDETMPWNVGEKGGAVRWWLVEEEEAAAVRCRRRNASLERRRCAGRWELCVTVVLVVGEVKVGRRR
ncbi:hypothetical protein DEO72_LG1g2413 [Vigna unguiculata]|uniref:Uncharacterized protein n=1 Tax=Vigna unguiculata TaxID=3917 RepID=A0A4D6KSP3_VIGUN|nr:hypothetical protein DEO72_LG1g2413 [Vigna unguiculata]